MEQRAVGSDPLKGISTAFAVTPPYPRDLYGRRMGHPDSLDPL